MMITQKGKNFLHSHTYSGNALAASIACEVIQILLEDKMCQRAEMLGNRMRKLMFEVANRTKLVDNVRGIGAVVAADLVSDNSNRRLGFEVFQKAIKLGAFMRPLGNTIYWLPPLNTDFGTLDHLKDITIDSILSVY